MNNVWGDLADTSATTETLVPAVTEHDDRWFDCMSSVPRRLQQTGPVVSGLILQNTQLVSRQGTWRRDICMFLEQHDSLVFRPFHVTWTHHFLQRDMCILSGSAKTCLKNHVMIAVCSAKYQQCGGQNWTGSKVCCAGSTCKKQISNGRVNRYCSQCL